MNNPVKMTVGPWASIAAMIFTISTLMAGREASGQSWPAKPVRVISPIGAGSAADILARTFTEQLSAQLGQTIIVENRPGAGGTLGANAVAKSDPDGYTILIHSNGLTIAPAVYPNLPYDTVRDFIAIAPLASFPNVLVVAPSKNIRTAQELVAFAKAQQHSINYASGGVGTPTHLAAERFRLSALIDAQHIPFKSQPEALTEVIAGRVDFYFCPVFPALPFIREGKLIALAVSSAERVSTLPNVPTTLEAGFANSDYNFWVGMFLPAKTSRDIVDKLHRETVKALHVSTLQEKLAHLGVEPMTMTPEQFGDFVKNDIVANAALAKAAGITPQ